MPDPRPIAAALLLLTPPMALPLHPTPAHAQNQRMEDVREQGVLYYKKGRFKQARKALDQAFAMKGGPGDFAVVYYRGMTAFKLSYIELANEMADMADRLAVDRRRKRRVGDLKASIRTLYGPVTFRPSPNESNRRGRIFFEAKTGIINPEKKKQFALLQERYKSTSVTLPTTLFLPYGDYTANNVPFSVVEGAKKPPTVELFLQVAEDDAGGAMLPGSTWLWVGVGAAVAVGVGVGAVLLLGDDEPAPTPDYLRVEFD